MIKKFGAWRSPVAHHNGVVGVASSNLVAPTLARKAFIKEDPLNNSLFFYFIDFIYSTIDI